MWASVLYGPYTMWVSVLYGPYTMWVSVLCESLYYVGQCTMWAVYYVGQCTIWAMYYVGQCTMCTLFTWITCSNPFRLPIVLGHVTIRTQMSRDLIVPTHPDSLRCNIEYLLTADGRPDWTVVNLPLSQPDIWCAVQYVIASVLSVGECI